MSLPKPVLRGHLNRKIARHLILSIGAAAVAGVTFYFTVSQPRKERYANFYKNYDPMVDFRRMRDLDLLVSAKPGETE